MSPSHARQMGPTKRRSVGTPFSERAVRVQVVFVFALRNHILCLFVCFFVSSFAQESTQKDIMTAGMKMLSPPPPLLFLIFVLLCASCARPGRCTESTEDWPHGPDNERGQAQYFGLAKYASNFVLTKAVLPSGWTFEIDCGQRYECILSVREITNDTLSCRDVRYPREKVIQLTSHDETHMRIPFNLLDYRESVSLLDCLWIKGVTYSTAPRPPRPPKI